MDIRSIEADPTDGGARRGRCPAWRTAIGLGRRPARRSPRCACVARRRQGHAGPAASLAPGAAGAAGARRLDQRRWPGLRLRSSERPAGRRLGGRHLLCAARDLTTSATRVHVCDDIACKCAGARRGSWMRSNRSVGPGLASGAARLARYGRRRAPSGCARRAWACAIRRRQRW